MTALQNCRASAARLRTRFSRLLKDSSANTLAIMGLGMVPLVGTVGIGVDVAQWNLWKRQLHSAADMSALAGAAANSKSKDADTAARRALALNDLRDYNIIAIESPPTEGAHVGDDTAVRVVLTTQSSLPFSGMFMDSAPEIRVVATATAGFEVPQCVIALDTTGTPLIITGSSTVDMNCGIGSNANFDATTSDMINAGALSSVGTIVDGGNITPDTKLNQGISPISDPYAGKLPDPDLSTLCSGATAFKAKVNQVSYLTPGCFTDLNVAGDLHLSPGTYYIDGGDFSMGAKGYLQGTGVTLVLTNSNPDPAALIGEFDFNGSSKIQISAPSTGDYTGVVMYQDPRAIGTINKVNGSAGTNASGKYVTSNIEGAIYAPNSLIQFNGNSSMSSDCMQLVGKRVTLTGNTTISNKCSPGSGASSFSGVRRLRLVE